MCGGSSPLARTTREKPTFTSRLFYFGYNIKDEEHNHAIVLKEVLEKE